MLKVGVIGLGDMGSGLAKNLIANGFETYGLDLLEKRREAFTQLGGHLVDSTREMGEKADIVFVMVMTGEQAKSVVLGDGLASTMKAGSIIILTATIIASQARDLADGLAGTGIDLIDSPVSGGFPGAQGGTLTMMAAAPSDVLKRAEPAMQAVSASIHHVGDEIGMGQTVKACLQSLIGSIFSATFEATTLAAKAGVSGQVLYDVVSSSSASCGVANGSIENIMDRKFEGTGSHIATMYKDLTISLDMARELGVPLFTAATAMQLFQAGKTKFPNGDNWTVARVSEEIVDVEFKR